VAGVNLILRLRRKQNGFRAPGALDFNPVADDCHPAGRYQGQRLWIELVFGAQDPRR
jgi:hypothetical protein